MKKITIEVPEGKKAKWEGNSIIFVDDNVMDRVKTFTDACNELGENNDFLKEYQEVVRSPKFHFPDLTAYLRLRIIVAALNEDWEPTFGKILYYPWFKVNRTFEFYGIVTSSTDSNYTDLGVGVGMRLAFKNAELAQYAATQFVNEYKEFLLK